MRRILVLLAAIVVTLVVASRVALAVNKIGTNGPDILTGTNRDDNLLGKGGKRRKGFAVVHNRSKNRLNKPNPEISPL